MLDSKPIGQINNEELLRQVRNKLPEMPITVQDAREKNYKSFAQSAQVIGIPKPEPVAYINVEERKLEWATPIKWETPTTVKMDKVPLYTAPPQQNEFNPDWDAMSVMVEEQQRMAKRIEELEAKLKEKNT